MAALGVILFVLCLLFLMVLLLKDYNKGERRGKRKDS
jgi:hypothetical protein